MLDELHRVKVQEPALFYFEAPLLFLYVSVDLSHLIPLLCSLLLVIEAALVR